VHHDVGAERDGLLQVGRGEGVVDDEQRAGVVRHLGERGDVGDAQQRVGGRLDPDDPGRAGRTAACMASTSATEAGVYCSPHGWATLSNSR
jgi:hypothetical protein